MSRDRTFTRFFKRERSNNLTARGRKKTKVVATVGPACESPEVLEQMFHVGMNVARLNMSHGSHDDHCRRMDLVRSISDKVERPVAVLADLQGPKIRTGKLANGGAPVELVAGNEFVITTDPWPEGNEEKVGTTYDGLASDVNPGNTILINDGRIRLEVIDVSGNDIKTKVILGGQLTDSKGINLPGVKVSAPSLSDKDKADLAWAIEKEVDYIALSFVRTALDVQHVRRRIEDAGITIPIIAKIERDDAVDNIDEILRESDGIMVARGDLGIEINTERLPVVQKYLITKANAAGKLVITATQMLESMIENPFPTRAESSDVANAVFDGSDAIMLSGETAVGDYPVEAVAEMNRIAVDAEDSPYMPKNVLDEQNFKEDMFSLAMTGSLDYLARTLDVNATMVFSPRDHKALLLSKRRNPKLAISICHNARQWRRQSLYWGTIPLLAGSHPDPQDCLELGINDAVRHELTQSGEKLVVLFGADKGRARSIKVVDV